MKHGKISIPEAIGTESANRPGPPANSVPIKSKSQRPRIRPPTPTEEALKKGYKQI